MNNNFETINNSQGSNPQDLPSSLSITEKNNLDSIEQLKNTYPEAFTSISDPKDGEVIEILPVYPALVKNRPNEYPQELIAEMEKKALNVRGYITYNINMPSEDETFETFALKDSVNKPGTKIQLSKNGIKYTIGNNQEIYIQEGLSGLGENDKKRLESLIQLSQLIHEFEQKELGNPMVAKVWGFEIPKNTTESNTQFMEQLRSTYPEAFTSVSDPKDGEVLEILPVYPALTKKRPNEYPQEVLIEMERKERTIRGINEDGQGLFLHEDRLFETFGLNDSVDRSGTKIQFSRNGIKFSVGNNDEKYIPGGLTELGENDQKRLKALIELSQYIHEFEKKELNRRRAAQNLV